MPLTGQIHFFSEDTTFQLKNKRAIRHWIGNVLTTSKRSAGIINYIFCSDAYLLELNRKHLQHDYLTDIITFPVEGRGPAVSADIFISIERVKENAKTLGFSFTDELHRVMIHGVLHLLGYQDKKKADALIMRRMENKMLSLRPFLR